MVTLVAICYGGIVWSGANGASFQVLIEPESILHIIDVDLWHGKGQSGLQGDTNGALTAVGLG